MLNGSCWNIKKGGGGHKALPTNNAKQEHASKFVKKKNMEVIHFAQYYVSQNDAPTIK